MQSAHNFLLVIFTIRLLMHDNDNDNDVLAKNSLTNT